MDVKPLSLPWKQTNLLKINGWEDELSFWNGPFCKGHSFIFQGFMYGVHGWSNSFLFVQSATPPNKNNTGNSEFWDGEQNMEIDWLLGTQQHKAFNCTFCTLRNWIWEVLDGFGRCDSQSNTTELKSTRFILLMVQKSSDHKLILVLYPSHYLQGFSTIPGGFSRQISEPPSPGGFLHAPSEVKRPSLAAWR